MRPCPFFIDKIINSIENVVTGEVYETEVLPFTTSDLKYTSKRYGWNFDWKEERKKEGREVYKLVIKGKKEIQGLISYTVMRDHIELYLIETAPHNYGRKKKYFGVAANLVAFTCRESFDLGFEGYVSFIAKNQLIQHYINTLGAQLLFKSRMCIPSDNARKLVSSCYKNYFHD